MEKPCTNFGHCGHQAPSDEVLCKSCIDKIIIAQAANARAELGIQEAETRMATPPVQHERRTMAQLYPKYYKRIPKGVTELDVYAVCDMFPVDDPSGCINHARKKLLVPGTRTGGKSMYKDIKEARDTLNRWLELYDARNEQSEKKAA